jgi:hypothetical protein
VGPRAGLDVVVDRKIPNPWLKYLLMSNFVRDRAGSRSDDFLLAPWPNAGYST